MLVEEELAGFSPEKDTILTVGVFDGVHLGHKHLISKLLEQARQRNLLAGVVTFRQHPEELLSPQAELPFLTDIENHGKFLTVDEFMITSFMIQKKPVIRPSLTVSGYITSSESKTGENN